MKFIKTGILGSLFISALSISFANVNHNGFSYNHLSASNDTVVTNVIGDALLTNDSARAELTPIQKADSIFAEYNKANSANLSKDMVFGLLNECTKIYISILDNKDVESTDVNDYIVSKERLRVLHPYMQLAGVYYSQQNKTSDAVEMLSNYIKIPKLPAFKDELFNRSEYYPTLVYYVASNVYNLQKFNDAIFFLKEYLSTNDRTNEKKTLYFLSKCYGYEYQYEDQLLTLMRGIQLYPKDTAFLHDIVAYHIKTKNIAQAELYLQTFEKYNPNPKDIYSLKAGIAELKGDYQESYNISEALYSLEPNNYEYAKMFARSNYNFVVMEMNKGNVKADGKPADNLIPYLKNAERLFVTIVNKKPEKAYLDGLIDTYLLLDEKDKAMEIARSIGRQLSDVKDNKQMLTESTSQDLKYSKMTSYGVPFFSLYLKGFMTEHLRSWMQKGEYEKKSDYERRINGDALEEKKKSLIAEAKNNYIQQYSGTMNIKGIVIDGYDADHEVYLIKYNLGNMLVRVPLADNQAQKFQEDWGLGNVHVSEPKFDIDGDSLVLSGLTFKSPSGISYKYDINENITYESVDVKVVNPLLTIPDEWLADIDEGHNKQNIDETTVMVGDDNMKSDIDVDLPTDSVINKYTFALIISNENYQFADKVNYALSDGKSFKNYCRKVLGIPEKNIMHSSDASYLGMKGQIQIFVDLVKEYADSARVMVYYSGHGIPSFETQEAFLLPVDGSPENLYGTIPIADFYQQLSSTNVRTINVFLDCCFSGAGKTGNMLAEARGTVIKPKANDPKGNMIVMSACSGDEVAFHYNDQRHGMFTYFLLKRLKDTQGNATLGDIYSYVLKNVNRQALHDKKKKQTPSIIIAPRMEQIWHDMKLK